MTTPTPSHGEPKMDGTTQESANDRYERRAAAFHEATGMMAPGKDVPAACGADDFNARFEAWVKWCAENSEPVPEPRPPKPHVSWQPDPRFNPETGTFDASLPREEAREERTITRVEVIDHRSGPEESRGRVFAVVNGAFDLSYQDGGRTLKVFVSEGSGGLRAPLSSGSAAPEGERTTELRAAIDSAVVLVSNLHPKLKREDAVAVREAWDRVYAALAAASSQESGDRERCAYVSGDGLHCWRMPHTEGPHFIDSGGVRASAARATSSESQA